MIISKTPFRCSLVGSSSDYESYYSKYGALMLGFTMDKYCYISVRRTPKIFDHGTRVSYSKIETVDDNYKIEHNGVRGCLEFLGIKDRLEISCFSDLPARTGIGSSSAFVVGLLNCLYKLKGESVSPKRLAKDAIHVERKCLSEIGGIQDQIFVSYGGLKSVHIPKDGDFRIKPLPVSSEFVSDFFSRAILIYTGQSRQSFKIAKSHDSEAAETYKHNIKALAESMLYEFTNENIEGVADRLLESWWEKKKISDLIATEEVDSLYNSLREDDGMLGGKLLGAGGSGFIFGIMESPAQKDKVREKYNHHYVECGLSQYGSRIINE